MLKRKNEYSIHTSDTLLKLFHVITATRFATFFAQSRVRQDTFVDHDAIKLGNEPKAIYILGIFLKIYTLISKCFIKDANKLHLLYRRKQQ